MDVILEEFLSFIESHYGDGSEQSNHTDDGDTANFGSSISKDICMGRVLWLLCIFFLTDCHPLEGTKQASGRVLFSEATKA